jgi:hypothetical protein
MSITPLNWITFFLFFGGNPEGQAFLIVVIWRRRTEGRLGMGEDLGGVEADCA